MLHRQKTPDSASAPPPVHQPASPSTTKEGKVGYWQLAHDRLQHFEVPWSEAPDHFERLLQALHCVPQYSLGTRGTGFWVDVYRNKKATPQLSFQFLVTLNTPSDSDTVLVDDLPDLLNMLEHLAPIIQLSMASTRQEGPAAQKALVTTDEDDSSAATH